MLHVRVEEELKNQAAEVLANFGLSTSELIRMLLTRVVKEGCLPAGLTMDERSYDAWFRAKVSAAMQSLEDDDTPHADFMHELRSSL